MALRDYARSMRHASTPSELRLWSWLRDRRFVGYKFRRQHPIGGYILDFYCPELKLAVEVDGRQHDAPFTAEYDDERTLRLKTLGIRVLRIPNEVIAADPESAADYIRIAIAQT